MKVPIGKLLDGLAPHRCQLCGLASHRPLRLCLPCQRDIRHHRHRCARCALPLHEPLATDLCGRCLRREPIVHTTLAAYCYAAPLDRLLWALKFGGETTLAPVLAELMAVAVEEWLEREAVPDLLVPMPLHWSRQLYRGFNQASLLATALVRHPRLRHYQLHTAHRLCRRVRPTGIQSRLGRRDRLRNLQGAFNSKPLLAGQHVVIVDDVFTTGASIEQLAGALRQAGAGRVDAWCCARTPEPVH